MRVQKITLCGKEFELYYSTKAMLDVEKRCGDTNKLNEWLKEDGTTAQILSKLSGILTDLANGAIFKHNSEVTLGLIDEPKKKFVDDELMLSLLTPADLLKAKEAIYSAINSGMSFEVPEGVPEPDPDLADVESEKNV